MSQVREIVIDMTAFAAAGNKSPLIPVNNAGRVTLLVQVSAVLSAGEWALKSVVNPDTSIPGAVVASAPFQPTPARVFRGSAEVADKWVYVEQVTAPTGGTVQAITVLMR
jgi:hypothetical protein